MKKDSRLAWGITLLFFGILFLLSQFYIFSPKVSSILFDARNYPIYGGIIFLISHRIKTVGWTLLLFGILLRLFEIIPGIIKFNSEWAKYIWPALLVIAGAILVFGVKKGKS